MSTERLAKWLRIAIKQNEHDMLLTDEEIREARAALAAHEAEMKEKLSTEDYLGIELDRVTAQRDDLINMLKDLIAVMRTTPRLDGGTK